LAWALLIYKSMKTKHIYIVEGYQGQKQSLERIVSRYTKHASILEQEDEHIFVISEVNDQVKANTSLIWTLSSCGTGSHKSFNVVTYSGYVVAR